MSDELVDTTAGPFAVRRYEGDSAPVLAVHGVSSNNRLWLWLHQAAPEVTLLAPDLPGRGGTPARPGPSSVAAHADGLAALLDALGLETVDVLGMSLGGFVAVELAARHPDRVRTLTLVDGGLPVPRTLPPEALREALPAQYGDTTDWPSVAAYATHYAATAASLVDPADPLFVEFLAHDLRDGAAGGPVRRDLATVVDDAVSVLGSEEPAAAWARVQAPTRLVHAGWSVGPDSAPMYPAEHVARFPELVRVERVADVDHAGTVMTDRGAAVCGAVLREAVSRPR